MLFDAVQYGQIYNIHYAYTLGTDMNSRDTNGLTALHIAAIYQTDVIAQTLLTLGASHDVTAKANQTPLYYAARYNNSDVLHALLDAGADINAQDEIGNTALHVAVYMGHATTVQELLLRGASKNLENRDAHTPEDFAVSREFHDITPFVSLTAKEQTQRVPWVSPPPTIVVPALRKRRQIQSEWRKPDTNQPPTNSYPLSAAEHELLELLPLYFIEPAGQTLVEYEESAQSEWP